MIKLLGASGERDELYIYIIRLAFYLLCGQNSNEQQKEFEVNRSHPHCLRLF